jgi:hypothetical protein
LEKYQNLNINQIFNKNIIDFNKYAISRLNNLAAAPKKDKHKPKLTFTSIFNTSFISYFIILAYLLYKLLILFNQTIITL